MPRPLPENRLQAVVAVLDKHPDGATLIQVAAALSPVAPLRNVQRWLGALTRERRIVRVGQSRSTRYQVADAGGGDVLPSASAAGRAIHVLVTQPLAERAPADYRRISLEGYRPNVTALLSAADRARVAARPVSPGWREPAALARTAAELVWRTSALEEALTDAGAGGDPTPPLPEIVAALAQPPPLGAARHVQRWWAVRTALLTLVDRAASVQLTREAVLGLYAEVASPGRNAGGLTAFHVAAAAPDAATLSLRTSALVLPQTSYCPPADPRMIESCFAQVLTLAAAITDPAEQALFVWMHLLYLQPFPDCNVTMACLLANASLLRAGLAPMTFASVRTSDLLAGARGVWELNRMELLRDVFVAG